MLLKKTETQVVYANRQMARKIAKTSIIKTGGSTFKALCNLEPLEKIYVIMGLFDDRKTQQFFCFV